MQPQMSGSGLTLCNQAPLDHTLLVAIHAAYNCAAMQQAVKLSCQGPIMFMHIFKSMLTAQQPESTETLVCQPGWFRIVALGDLVGTTPFHYCTLVNPPHLAIHLADMEHPSDVLGQQPKLPQRLFQDPVRWQQHNAACTGQVRNNIACL